ncbi:MAG: insulinase family protein [Clostridia bacterium]|nr:insulinase family protein [Clostridia bacterium]
MIELGQIYHGFLFKEKTRVPELNADVYIAKHQKSGARLMYVDCSDENKVFSIAFKTVPEDDTGVMHILEHSVLNGSDRYPAREPFVELLKSSMQTFLNAMTYPDKTMYPIASCNEKDFENLMAVYLDAVFHPAIYHKKEIFLQEGWHYEPASDGKDECFRGVVYNEMKGAMSSEDSILTEMLQNTIFPDVCYGKNSGGAPEAIPTLTYEDFIATHKKFYHPENSYIYLYGDMDVMEKLRYMDEEYLSHYERINADIKVGLQPDRGELYAEGNYESADDKSQATHYALGYKVCTYEDREKALAVSILLDAISSDNESPFKKAILDRGIAKDAWMYIDTSLITPYVAVGLKHCSDDDAKIKSAVNGILSEIANGGISPSLLEAALNRFEFRYREADFGNMPAGLVYCDRAMSSWLYGGDPTLYLFYEDALRSIREKSKEGYFEELIRAIFLNSKHSAMVKLTPESDFTAKKDAAERERVKEYREKIGESGVKNASEELEALRKMQNTEDSEEVLRTIPVLGPSFIDPKLKKTPCETLTVNDVTVRFHNLETKKIIYISLFFNLGSLNEDDLPYASLAARLFGSVPAGDRTAAEIINALKIKTGSFSAHVGAYANVASTTNCSVYLKVSFSALSENAADAIDLVSLILRESRFDGIGEITKILNQDKMNREIWMADNGHNAASARVRSYFSVDEAISQKLNGVDYYYFIKRLASSFDENEAQKLSAVLAPALNSDNLMISATCDESLFETLKTQFSRISLPHGEKSEKTFTAEFEVKNEGFAIPSDISFVAKGGVLSRSGEVAGGALYVLAHIMTYDYLWNTIRAKGGAYGTGLSLNVLGEAVFYSYRDPNLRDTLTAYDAAYEYLKSFNPDEREMTKYIVGAVAASDKPHSPSFKANRSDTDFLYGITHEMREKIRGEMLQTTAADIRALAEPVKELCDKDIHCVFSSKAKLEQNSAVFKSIKSIK